MGLKQLKKYISATLRIFTLFESIIEHFQNLHMLSAFDRIALVKNILYVNNK